MTDTPSPPATQCAATTKLGRRCRAPVVRGTTRCIGHAEDGSEAFQRHREASVVGGRLRGLRPDPVPAVPLPDAVDLTASAGLRVAVAQALRATLALPVDASTAHAVAALVRVQLATIDADELLARVDRLERMHEATKPHRRPRVA